MIEQTSNIMRGIGNFELRVAFFNAVGLSMATGVPTYLDARIKTNIVWPPRSYPLGFWILLLAPLLFLGSVLFFRYVRSWSARTWVPSALLVAVGLASLRNFYPEFPHLNVIAWVTFFAVASIGASWIHYLPTRDDFLESPELLMNLKIERVKEMVALWRTFAVTLTASYVGLLIPWYGYYMSSTSKLLSDPGEALLLKLTLCGEVAIFSFWMFLGPIFEAWSKTSVVSNLLLRIRGDAA